MKVLVCNSWSGWPYCRYREQFLLVIALPLSLKKSTVDVCSLRQNCLVKEYVSEVTQSCPTLCDPMDCSLPGSLVHGIFQARILKWVAISFSRGSSWPRDRTQVSCIVGRHFTIWATRIFNFSRYFKIAICRVCIVPFHQQCVDRKFPGGPVVKTLCFDCWLEWTRKINQQCVDSMNGTNFLPWLLPTELVIKLLYLCLSDGQKSVSLLF